MIPHLSERALIQMPHGRDAQVAAAILREGGFLAFVCSDLSGLVAEIEKGAGFGLMT